MASKNLKLKRALDTLGRALTVFNKTKDKELAFLCVAKAFEIAVEYAWRNLRDQVEAEGVEALSPKAAVREAARLKLIDNPESWIEFINARNAGVHDYFGMGEKDYVDIAKDFLSAAKKL